MIGLGTVTNVICRLYAGVNTIDIRSILVSNSVGTRHQNALSWLDTHVLLIHQSGDNQHHLGHHQHHITETEILRHRARKENHDLDGNSIFSRMPHIDSRSRFFESSVHPSQSMSFTNGLLLHEMSGASINIDHYTPHIITTPKALS